MEKKRIYADNAATTRLCDEAFEAMVLYLKQEFGNPSGIYEEGITAKRAINDARHIIARSLEAYDKEIIFTGGGSESDNLAIKGVMEANKGRGRHFITTNIEHHAVLSTADYLERNGYRVTRVPVKENGIVDPKDIEACITNETVLISVMYANNELGTIQPVKEIGEIAKKHGVYFHVDAVQAYAKEKIIPSTINADLLSASAHKFGGPKGVGFLYCKSGTCIKAVIDGGSQERGLRGGTENVASIVGMGVAASLAIEKMKERSEYERSLRDYLYKQIISNVEGVLLNGDEEKRMPGILNLTVSGVEGESLLINLDMKGIAASTGSACAMALEEPSHVLRAIGRSYDETRGSVRLSINHENTMEEMDIIVTYFKESVDYLRRLRLM